MTALRATLDQPTPARLADLALLQLAVVVLALVGLALQAG